MSTVEEIRIQLPHIHLAARVYGPADGRPVLALHGWMDNAMSFEHLAPRLAGLRIVALDMAGHGHSGHRGPGADYQLWDYALDALMAAHELGWQRFTLLGHSLGGIVATLIAAAVPERVAGLALIDGLLPLTAEAEEAPRKLGDALRERIALAGRKKNVYADVEQAVEARMRGVVPVSREAARLLAQRGVSPVAGGFAWNTDQRLTLPSPLRFTREHALHFVRALQCPSLLVLAEQGLLLGHPGFEAFIHQMAPDCLQLLKLAGDHHLHLNDVSGAQQVADALNQFFTALDVAGQQGESPC